MFIYVWPPTNISKSNHPLHCPPQVLMPLVSLASLACSLPSTAAAARGGGGVTRVKRIVRQGKQMKELHGAAKTAFDQNMMQQLMKVFWELLGLTILLYLPEPRAHVPS